MHWFVQLAVKLIPEGYSTFEYYLLSGSLFVMLLSVKVFILYIYYGLPLTLVYVVLRVFLKRCEPLKLGPLSDDQ